MSNRTTRHRRVAAAGLTAAALVAVGIGATQALFTDEETITSNVFGSGTIDLTTTPTTARFNVPSMMPGDVVTLPVTVGNAGSESLRYAVTSEVTAGDAAFAAGLELRIRANVTSCGTATFSTGGSDVVIPAIPLAGGVSETPVFGNNAQGGQAGDRTLANGANEVLCTQVTLPLSADNTMADGTVTVAFNFYAEQTKNNA